MTRSSAVLLVAILLVGCGDDDKPLPARPALSPTVAASAPAPAPAPSPVPVPAAAETPTAAPQDLTPQQFDRAKFIYFNTCGGCHGTLRKGATGPELSPARVKKLGHEYVTTIIKTGTPKGMPGWGVQGVLKPEEVDLMGKFLTMEPPEPPLFNLDSMRKTWKVVVPPDKRPTAPKHSRNWENFFGVILRDAGKVAIIDGDTKDLVSVIDTGFAVHILRASATGRYFYSIGRDGKVTLIDLWMDPPQLVAELKTGIEARSVDVSKYKGPLGDFEDKNAIVGCYWPPHFVVLDGQTLKPLKIVSTSGYTCDDNEFLRESRVASIVASHHSPSWIVCLKETGYVWLVDYSNLKNMRIAQVDAERFLHDGGWDATKRYFLVAANMRDTVCVVDAKEQKLAAKIKVGVKPHPGRGANFEDPEFGPVWATVHLGSAEVSVIGTDPEKHAEHAFKVVRTLKTLSGGSLFIKTHPNSDHVWLDHTLNSDLETAQTLLVFDKKNLAQDPKKLRVSQSGRVVHMEYDKAGKEVWVSVWDQKGEIVVYDDTSLEVKKRITGDWVVTPTGKFNVFNTARDVY